jgi:hypothetical protein
MFVGCDYIGVDGKPVSSPFWPASTALQAGSEAIAYVIDDQNTMFRIGVGGNATDYVQTAVGQQCNVANVGTGTVNTGLSSASVTAALVAAGTLAQLRIEGFFDGPYNATTNPFPQLLVKLVEVQFAPNAVGV